MLASRLSCFFYIQAYLDTQQAFSDWFKHYHNKPVAPNPAEPTSFYGSVSISELVAEEHRYQKICFKITLAIWLESYFAYRQKKYDDDVQMWRDRLDQLCNSVSKKIYNVLLFPQGWLKDNAEVR